MSKQTKPDALPVALPVNSRAAASRRKFLTGA